MIKVYLHIEDAEFTCVFQCEEKHTKLLSEFSKLVFEFLAEKHQIFVEKAIMLNDREKPVMVVKDKMDIFLNEIVYKKDEKGITKASEATENTKQQHQPETQKSSSSQAPAEARIDLKNPQLLAAAQSLQEAAIAQFEKKRYRSALEIYNRLLELKVDEYGCLLNLGMICVAARRYDEAVEYLQTASKHQAADVQVVDKLAQAYFGAKKYLDAMSCYTTLLKLVTNALSVQPENPTLRTVQLDTQIQIGRCLMELGEKKQAASRFANVLEVNQDHMDALLEYGKYMFDELKDYEEALSALLRCLVKDQKNEVAKLYIAKIMQLSDGIDILVKQLNTEISKMAPALAWIALICKEASVIPQSIKLYTMALQGSPHHTTYALNQIHTIMIQLDYQAAFDAMKTFFLNNKLQKLSIGKFTLNDTIIPLLEEIKNVYDEQYRSGEHAKKYKEQGYQLIWVEGKGAKLIQAQNGDVSNKKYDIEPVNDGEYVYNSQDLDLLAILFTLVKILYNTGALSVLPKIIDMLERLRLPNRRLHETEIRNEHAYFCCISHLMVEHSARLPLEAPLQENASPNSSVIYVCGESHCMSSAWQFVNVGSGNVERKLLKPTLVTGLKCWHLRPESTFYPKANFNYAMKKIPKGAKVVFMFGEIDCREGILLAVEKCRYNTVEEGIEVAIDIYLNKLRQVQQEYSFDMYIHPVLPMLDVTRKMVLLFNKILGQRLSKPENSSFKLLSTSILVESILEEEQTKLKKEYELDGTHIHPRYILLLERALQEYIS